MGATLDEIKARYWAGEDPRRLLAELADMFPLIWEPHFRDNHPEVVATLKVLSGGGRESEKKVIKC